MVSWEVRVCLEDMHADVCASDAYLVPMEVRAGTGPQELELQTACESPYGYWKLNWVLYKSNTCSLPLGYILTPIFPFWNLQVLCYILVGWPCYNIHARQADVCLLYLLQELRAAPSQSVWTAQVNKSHSLSLDYLLQDDVLKAWTPSSAATGKWWIH